MKNLRSHQRTQMPGDGIKGQPFVLYEMPLSGQAAALLIWGVPGLPELLIVYTRILHFSGWVTAGKKF